MPRVQSCPNLVHRCDWPDWQSQIQVRTLCERSEHIGDETQATLKFPQPGASQGSHGHPDLCRRPCILFLHGKCQEVGMPGMPAMLFKQTRFQFAGLLFASDNPCDPNNHKQPARFRVEDSGRFQGFREALP
eukprot:g17547.t1